MKGRGQAKNWNCEEWAHKTKSIKKLPEHVKGAAEDTTKKAAIVLELEKQASSITQLLGIRAAALVLGVRSE
jgi:hypothetical protein